MPAESGSPESMQPMKAANSPPMVGVVSMRSASASAASSSAVMPRSAVAAAKAAATSSGVRRCSPKLTLRVVQLRGVPDLTGVALAGGTDRR